MNKINTSDGNVQLIAVNGKTINVSPSNIYTVWNGDTVSVLLIDFAKSSGLAIFTSRAEDLEINGTVYSDETEAEQALAEAIADASGGGGNMKIEVVNERPEIGEENTIYLVPASSGTSGNLYEEWIWVNNDWELFGGGEITVDLTNYYNKTETDGLLADKLDVSAYTPTDLSQYWTSAQTEAELDALSQEIEGEFDDMTYAFNELIDELDTKEEVIASAITQIIDTKQNLLSYYSEDTENKQASITIEDADNNLTAATSFFADGLGSSTVHEDGDEHYEAILDMFDRGVEMSYTYTSGGTFENGILSFSKDGNGLYVDINDENGITAFKVEGSGARINDEAIVTEGTLSSYQPLLTAGSGISIANDVISVTGGSSVTVDPTLDSGSTNPVANSAITTAIDAKQNTLTAGSGISIANDVISVTGGSSVTVDPTLNSGSTNPVANSAITQAIDAKADAASAVTKFNIAQTSEGSVVQYATADNPYGYRNIFILGSINGTKLVDANKNFNLVETSAITTSMTSSSTDAQVPSAKAVYDQFGGLKLVKCTQAEYDALVQAGTVDSSTLYIISNVVNP